MRIRKIFQLEKGKYSNQKEIKIPNRKRKLFQLEKGKYSIQKMENIPIRKSRKREILQLEKL